MRRYMLLIVTLAIALCSAKAAYAISGYLFEFESTYPGIAGTVLDSCNLCHTIIPATNPYGTAYAAAGYNFFSIEPLDSDGDGFSNITEINARTLPGDASSYPSSDTGAPTISTFTVPATSSSLTVSGITLTATDNVGVTGYMITESASAPPSGDPGWSTSAPNSYTAAIAGAHTLYAWAKDEAGNVSSGSTASVTITLPVSVIFLRNSFTGNNAMWQMIGYNIQSISNLPGIQDLNWTIAGVGDFNRDGSTDILWRNMTTGSIAVWYMSGASLASVVNLQGLPDPNWTIAGVNDFNMDGNPDILWRNILTGANAVWLMNGTTLTSVVNLPGLTNTSWAIVGVGDFNDDGKPDIIWRNTSTGSNAVWYMNGITVSGVANLQGLADTNWTIAGVGDFNDDGKPDILWRNTSTGSNAVWYMNGATLLGIDSIPLLPVTWKIAGVR